MNKKALALLSGGLDSILAIRLLQEQLVQVHAVNYSIGFCACILKDGSNAATRAADMLKTPLDVIDITEEYLDILKNPKHGYGANINPCIDCKIFMLKKAKDYMKEVGASFLVTGEVLGERPMSQRRDALNLIEKQAGVKGILLRPLSAKLLEPTVAEKEGIVDRQRLLGIQGRSRKPQFELAEQFGIKDFPNPAGGCLLTDPGFTKRIMDLIGHDELTVENLRLLTAGRHFRISKGAKLAVGRDKNDNELLETMATPGDIFLKLKDYQGPLAVLRGGHDEALILSAASITAYHTKFRNSDILRVDYWKNGSTDRTTLSVKPAKADQIEHKRIC